MGEKQLMVRQTAVSSLSQETVFVNRMKDSIYRAMSQSTLTGRSAIAAKLGESFGGKRDIYTALGYPGLNALTIDNFLGQYLRGDVAGRLIDAPVDGAWSQKPIVGDEGEGDSSFEKEWEQFVKDFGLWNILTRVDKLSGLGRFGVLLMGFDDVTTANDLVNEVTGTPKLLYLQPYSEKSAVIDKWDVDPKSPRYGYPLTYKLSIDQPGQIGDVGASSQLIVHYSRVIHIAEGLLESNIYGRPRLERGYNRLLNLELIVGGSAEMFWQGAFPGYAFIADAETDMTQTANDIETEIDMFVHDFKRYMKLQGLKVEKLSSDVADPKAHVDVQMTMLSFAYAMPKRIMTGSERGELASDQDEKHWNDQLQARRVDYIEPAILRPLIDNLIKYKILTAPKNDSYTVAWPDLNAPTDKMKAEVGKILSEAIRSYLASPEGALLMPFDIYLEEVLGFDKEKVKRVVDAQEAGLGEMIRREREADASGEIVPGEEEES